MSIVNQSKKVRDPEQPKGVRGPYLIFCLEMNSNAANDGKSIHPINVYKENSLRWSLMSNDEKNPILKLPKKTRNAM